jgi:nucleotide-binding universal stress UspA family protein
MSYEESHTESEVPSTDPTKPRKPSTILVPLDGTVCATDALPVAHGLAGLISATVHILYISSHPLPAAELCDSLHLATEDLTGAVLDQRTGLPGRMITEEAKKWESRLIVMCDHTAAGGSGEEFGVIAREILLHTPCPVVLVPRNRGQQPWSLRRLLVPHDGTPTSASALGLASELCQEAQARMTILHVATAAAPPSEDPGALNVPHYVDQPQYEWPAWGAEFLARAQAIGKTQCEVALRTVLCTDDAGEAIVRFASNEESDLIALAWRMHLEKNRAQTLRMVVRQARCPIAIYPILVQESNPKLGLFPVAAMPSTS